MIGVIRRLVKEGKEYWMEISEGELERGEGSCESAGVQIRRR